jgi:hypothetical protein
MMFSRWSLSIYASGKEWLSLKNGIHGSQQKGGDSILVTNPCAPAGCAAWINSRLSCIESIIMGTVGKIFFYLFGG